MDKLAILGGPKAVQSDPGDMFTWPIITTEDEEASLEVLRAGRMSQTDVTRIFEEEFAAWHSIRYALAHNTGTAALHGAMFGCKIGVGDEVIFGKYGGTDIELDGQEVKILRESDILAKVVS